MAYDRPTLQEISDRIVNDIKSRIAGATTFLRRSAINILGRVYAGAVHLLYGYIEYNKDQLFISTADVEHLERHGSDYGINRTAAVKATGSGTATGTDGIIIPANTELQSSDGQVYLTDNAEIISSGTAIISITAKIAGAAGNDDGGISLSFVSPIAGVNTSVTISAAGIDGGADEESDDSLRDRVLTRRRQPPHGGASFDYVTWMKEVSGVTRAWAISSYYGVGTVGLAFVRDDDDDLIPSESERTTVFNYIVSHTDPITGTTIGAPVTAEQGLIMIAMQKKSMNFTINIYPNTTDIQTAINAKLADLILVEGGASETIYLSEMRAAISAAIGEERHELVFPVSDISAAANEVHVMGTITYGDYNG